MDFIGFSHGFCMLKSASSSLLCNLFKTYYYLRTIRIVFVLQTLVSEKVYDILYGWVFVNFPCI